MKPTAIADFAVSMLGGGLLAPVRYSFTCREAPAVHWQVRRFELREALSEPYRLDLELVTEDIHAEADALLGAGATLDIGRATHGRNVHGVITRVEQLSIVAGRLRVRIELRPALALLDQRVDTRFWQQQRVPQILEAVLKDPLAALGRSLRQDLHASDFPLREYCVQYGESDLEFAARLMHEEGIVYHFEHEGDAELLVLTDGTTGARDLAMAPVPLVAKGSGAAIGQSVDALDWSRELRSTSIVQRDWDFENPGDAPHTRERRGKDARGRDREVYEHDDRRLVADDGDRRSRRKLEQRTCTQDQGRGRSDVVELVPGRRFTLLQHPRPDLDGKHLVIAVTHRGEAPETLAFAGSDSEQPRYINEFRTIRPEVSFRPQGRVPRPRVHGPHTAIVVGPDGEEIHTDELGRIKVRFHWDRHSPADDTASCWIRVAQAMAGPGWGGVLLPRIGMEVIVEFIDGDPDRPLVTGSVYNALLRPGITLPDNKTQNGIRSESSPGGGGFNELRLEDAKGREELFLHAQKDLKEVVLNNNTRDVTADQSFTIGGNQSFKVTGDQSFNITGKQNFTVKGDRSVTVEEGNESLTVSVGKSTTTIEGDRSVTVKTGASSLTVKTGTHTATVQEAIALESKAANIDLTAATAVSIGAGATLDAKGEGAVTVSSKTSTLALTGETATSLKSTTATLGLSGSTAVTLESKTSTLALSAKTDVTLSSATASVSIGAPLGVGLDGGLLLTATAKKIMIVAIEEIMLSVGGSTISIKGDGVSISGSKINSSAIGMHEISGALIKIN